MSNLMYWKNHWRNRKMDQNISNIILQNIDFITAAINLFATLMNISTSKAKNYSNDKLLREYYLEVTLNQKQFRKINFDKNYSKNSEEITKLITDLKFEIGKTVFCSTEQLKKEMKKLQKNYKVLRCEPEYSFLDNILYSINTIEDLKNIFANKNTEQYEKSRPKKRLQNLIKATTSICEVMDEYYSKK